MVVDDRKTLRILKYIQKYKKQGVTWLRLQQKFGEDNANIFLLEALNKESYVVTQNNDGEWIDFSQPRISLHSNFLSFATPKAKALIERKCFEFWKWAIPTFIPLVALVVSILALLK